MTKLEQQLYDMAEPFVRESGCSLYDVMYLKEGSEWYLRFFIDNENGIDLNICEKISAAISDVLDKNDPISTSYNLEVSSCGLERHLRDGKHFADAIGKNIEIKLYKAQCGSKQFIGALNNFSDNKLTLKMENDEVVIDIADIASAKILYNWEG